MERQYIDAYGKMYYLLNTEGWKIDVCKSIPKIHKIYNRQLLNEEMQRISKQVEIIKSISLNEY